MRELSLFTGAGSRAVRGKKTILCKVCGIEFTSYNKNPQFCSIGCKADFSRHPIDDDKVSELYLSGLTKAEVAGKLGVSRKVVENSIKRTGTPTRVAAKRDQWGDKNHMWKGDEAGYSCLHKRLHRRYGKENRCDVCGTTSPKKHYDYANLTGKYHDVNDYKRMCRSCHWKYDKTHLNFSRGKDMREEK